MARWRHAEAICHNNQHSRRRKCNYNHRPATCMNDWKNCKKILCIRADNMGDVIMSVPAIRALKERFSCHITLLTSAMGGLVKGCIEEVDEWMIFNAPWIKSFQAADAAQCFALIE